MKKGIMSSISHEGKLLERTLTKGKKNIHGEKCSLFSAWRDVMLKGA